MWNIFVFTTARSLASCERKTVVDRGKGIVMVSKDEEKPVHTSSDEKTHKSGNTVRRKYGEDYYRQIGKKGGIILKEKRGNDYYRMIAQKGGQANVNKYGSDHFSELGKKGGNTTKSRQGPDFYSRIGKLGGVAKKKKKDAEP
jgi:general stress protein YciG